MDVAEALWAAFRREIQTVSSVPEPTDGYTIRFVLVVLVLLIVIGLWLLLC